MYYSLIMINKNDKEALDYLNEIIGDSQNIAILVAEDSVSNDKFIELVHEIYKSNKTSQLFIAQPGIVDVPISHFLSKKELGVQLDTPRSEVGIDKFLYHIDNSPELSEFDFFILFGVPEEDQEFYDPRDNVAVFAK